MNLTHLSLAELELIHLANEHLEEEIEGLYWEYSQINEWLYLRIGLKLNRSLKKYGGYTTWNIKMNK